MFPTFISILGVLFVYYYYYLFFIAYVAAFIKFVAKMLFFLDLANTIVYLENRKKPKE